MIKNTFHIVKIRKGSINIVFNPEMFNVDRLIFEGTLKECKAFIEENYGVNMTLGRIKKGLYTEGMLKVQ